MKLQYFSQCEYEAKIESRNLNDQNPKRFYLDASFQGVKRLFVFVFDNTDNGVNKVEKNSQRNYFPQRVNITKFNVLIETEVFMINQLTIKSKNMMKLEKLQLGKEMIMQHDIC